MNIFRNIQVPTITSVVLENGDIQETTVRIITVLQQQSRKAQLQATIDTATAELQPLVENLAKVDLTQIEKPIEVK